MRDLLLEFHRVTRGRKPEHLVFFRDGVSEGQFKEVYYVSGRGVGRGVRVAWCGVAWRGVVWCWRWQREGACCTSFARCMTDTAE